MNRSWPGTSTNPISRPLGELAPGVPQIDREASPLLLVPAVGVDPGERDDQRGLAVVDMARRRDDAEFGTGRRRRRRPRSRQSSSTNSSPSIAYRTARAVSCTCSSAIVRASKSTWSSSTRQNTEGLPARSRAANAVRVGHGDANAPRRQGGPGHGPAAHHRLTSLDVGVFQVAAQRSRTDAGRACAPRSAGSRSIRWTGSLLLDPLHMHRQDLLQRRDLHLVDPDRSRDGVLAKLGDEVGACPRSIPACGPPSSLSPEHSTRSAPSAKRTRDGGLVGGHAALAVQQTRAHVVHQRHVVLGRQRGEVLRGGLGGEPDDAVVRRMHLQDGADAFGHGGAVVADAGAVGGADLDQLGARTPP